MPTSHPEIIVVGGSLAGLTFALASASRGVPVRVLERTERKVLSGDNLSVNLATIAATVGRDPRLEPKLPVVRAYRDRHLTSWPALYRWLRDRAGEASGITLEEDKTVKSVRSEGDKAVVAFADGTTTSADAVIGADCYHSTVRSAIAPELPLARYAGYIVWRGLIEESALSRPVRWPTNGGLWIDYEKGHRLVVAMLPGRDGSLEEGKRQVTFAWFNAGREDLLRGTNCLDEDGHVIGTLAASAISADVRDELASLVPQLWPETWAEAVGFGVRSGFMRGAPIAEYKPERLARGPMAIIGEAAHVLSPMTGSGYATGVEDAAILSEMLAQFDQSKPLSAVLEAYERARLPYTRALVNHSKDLSAEFLRYAAGFQDMAI
ncbi:FAD-dependent monooxygenase (plasmid) [Rhizobium bangladeshense]|uniref:FAD-dependent monooxygenase n=1 Tax=Rhizobium bangladeshense TaxID=1138189 RepID=UPI001A9A093C|nr:FAD-dependent monooxygenase [Rhizobium bangladeshense]QSY97947.1 FAD-dependent monooxygenase [Rhizobium bangladeshense]